MSLDLSKLINDANSGDKDALRTLCYHYLSSAFPPHNTLYAVEWVKKAARHDVAEAQYILGVMYLNGAGRNHSERLAQEWFDKAEKNGQSYPPCELLTVSCLKALSLKYPEYVPHWTETGNEDDNAAPSMDKSGLTFSDVAFKKDENGNLVVNVMPETPSYDGNYGSDYEDYRSSYEDYKNSEDYASTSRGSDLPPNLNIHYVDYAQNPDAELEALVGLSSLKGQIQKFKSRIVFEKKRQEAGMPSYLTSNHFVFNGAPGTGKTSVARIIGHILRKEGILSKGHVVEVDRGDLIGEYVGKTAVKTKKVIDAAKGGVLFIDEAYALNDGYELDYGHEALATLVKAMEDERADLVVIMAGYAEEMRWLVKSNPGLESRIRHHITFDNFEHDELIEIFERRCVEHGYEIEAQAKSVLSDVMHDALKKDIGMLGNARFVRNVFEKTLENMAVRVVNISAMSDQDLKTILFMDIPSFSELSAPQKPPPSKGTGTVVHI